jgi:uroporphyrinogen-III synthase
VVGKRTATVCKENKIPVNIISKEFSSDGIIKTFSKIDIKNKNIFIPRSEIAGEELPEKLRELGARVITTTIYKVCIPSKKIIDEQLTLLKSAKPDLFIFTSPSTFIKFLEILKIPEPIKYFNGYDIAAIGPTTKEEIEKYNIKVKIIPQEYTMDGLVETIKNYYSN